MHAHHRIVILGAGHVGSHVASGLAMDGIADEIVLVDIVPGKAAAQAMDISDALTFPCRKALLREGTLSDCEGADAIVCAIGKPREPGQTRLDLLADSARMVHALALSLRPFHLTCPIISITNPCDIIADLLRRELQLDRTQVFGTGTLLDTARLRRTLSEQTGIGRDQIDAFVLGEHGDSSMIPFSCVHLSGRTPGEVPGFDADAALLRTHEIGMDIINGKGSTEFGIGQATTFLIRAILEDTHAVLPLSAELRGEYRLSGLHCGVPCRVGRKGIEEVIELPLEEDELSQLHRSADIILRHINMARDILSETAP
ncbi:MAG: L-lactate dehydrogenase [Clostridia bacterium]|nr:L-lactate dehydrogenase [Clostridia bacterium]